MEKKEYWRLRGRKTKHREIALHGLMWSSKSPYISCHYSYTYLQARLCTYSSLNCGDLKAQRLSKLLKLFCFISSNSCNIGPGSHYCENVGRCHKSNHNFFVANFVDGVFCQKCHDPDCSSFRYISLSIQNWKWPTWWHELRVPSFQTTLICFSRPFSALSQKLLHSVKNAAFPKDIWILNFGRSQNEYSIW